MEYQFEKLKVYQESLDLVEKVYEITKKFPQIEQFGITSRRVGRNPVAA